MFVSRSTTRTEHVSPPRMEAYDKAKEAGNKSPAKAVSHMKGYFRSCMYKWAKARARENWSLICRAHPRLAKRHRELPDLLRKFMGQTKRVKSRAAEPNSEYTEVVPPEFEEMVCQALVS